MQVIANREIKSACIQVLFSAVYHLQSAVLPYSFNLIKLCLKFLKEGSEKVLKDIHILYAYAILGHQYQILAIWNVVKRKFVESMNDRL